MLSKTRASVPSSSSRCATSKSEPVLYPPRSTATAAATTRVTSFMYACSRSRSAFFSSPALMRAQQHRIERLRQIVLRAALDAAHDAGDVVERGDHDHRNVLRVLRALEALECLVSVHPRHHHVQQHHVERLRGSNLASASAPLAAHTTLCPSLLSRRCNTPRFASTSSTTRIRAERARTRLSRIRRNHFHSGRDVE